jgi:hypothetical protein
VCEASDNNLIENNVMSFPRVRKNITSWSPCGKHGTGNVLRRNCIHPATFEGAEGYALQNNLHVDPRYVDPGGADFRLQGGSPCAPLLDHPDLPGTGPLPVPGIRPIAPPIGQRFGVAQAQLPGARPLGGAAGVAVTLRALRRSVRPGGRVVLMGRVARPNGRKVRLKLRRRGRWVATRAVRQRAGGSFRARLRLRRLPHASRAGRTPLTLQRTRLPRRVRKLVLAAHVPGVGRSAPVRVRVRR